MTNKLINARINLGGANMPVKHIDDETWKKIEQKTVKEIIKTSKSVKEGKMLKDLILIGLKHYDEEQLTINEKKNRRVEDNICKKHIG
jgi:TnpA family transposase